MISTPNRSIDMEEVWLKHEPVDDSFEDDCLSVKVEYGTEINVEPLVIIEQDESKQILQIPDPIRKGANKSRGKISQRRQLEKGENDEKKSSAGKLTQSIKKTHVCDECGKQYRDSYDLKCHKLLHTGHKPFVCPVENCGATFTRNSSLKVHQMCHSGERKCFCEECGQGFLSKFQMQLHQRTKHRGERPFVCGECGQGYTRKQGLIRHERAHRGNKPFACECGMRFYEKTSLKWHKETHTADGMSYTCAECGKGFYNKPSLNAHERNHSKPFECEECGIRFAWKFTLKQHRMKQHGLSTPLPKQQQTMQISVTVAEPKIFSPKANVSQSSYTSTGPSESHATFSTGLVAPKQIFPLKDLNDSKEADSSQNKFVLDTNSDEYTNFEEKFVVEPTIEILPPEISTSLDPIEEETRPSVPLFDIWKCVRTTPDDEHQPRKRRFAASLKKPYDKSIELPVHCDKCDRKFAFVRALKIHQRSHKRVREQLSFVCGECGKEFAGKHQLTMHKRIHSGIAFSCTECDRSFNQVGNLKKHQQTHTNTKNFQCDVCGLKLTRLSHIERHKLTHTGIKNFGCEVCGMTFAQKHYVKIHMRIHAEGKPFACDQCSSKFVVESQLTRHQRDCHRGEDEPSPYCRRKMAKAASIMEVVNDST